jgi:hypothetical protein
MASVFRRVRWAPAVLGLKFAVIVTLFVMVTAPAAWADVTANADVAVVVEDGSVTVEVLLNDTTDGSPLSIASVTAPANGSAVISGTTITYSPAADFSGSDSFVYEITADGFFDTAPVFVTVTEANDPPVANPDSAATLEESAVTFNVLANDTDPESDALTLINVDGAANGLTTFDSGGNVTFTPNPDFSGSEVFGYTVADSRGGVGGGIVTVTVTGVNDPPVAGPDRAFAIAGVPLVVDVLANDADIDGDSLTIVAVGDPANGTASITAGTIDYIAEGGFSGIDAFSYTISDGALTATATISVTVTATNLPPNAENDSVATTEEVGIVINVLANDADPDGNPLEVDSVGPAAHGSTALLPGGTISYTPEPGFIGVDGFSYRVHDGLGGSATATVTVTVTESLAGPALAPDSAAVDEDGEVEIAVLANDELTEGSRVSSLGQPVHGTVTLLAGDRVLYRPEPEFSGFDSFTYAVTDDLGRTAFAAVTVNVVATNDPPIVRDDSVRTAANTPVAVDVLANDSDPDGEILFIQLVTSPANGRVALAGDGFVYTPDAGFAGVDRFTYRACDGIDCVAASVEVVVAAPAALPDDDPANPALPQQSTDVPPSPLIARPTLTPSLGFSTAARATMESLAVLLLPLTMLGVLLVWALSAQRFPYLIFWRKRGKEDESEDESFSFYR